MARKLPVISEAAAHVKQLTGESRTMPRKLQSYPRPPLKKSHPSERG